MNKIIYAFIGLVVLGCGIFIYSQSLDNKNITIKENEKIEHSHEENQKREQNTMIEYPQDIQDSKEIDQEQEKENIVNNDVNTMNDYRIKITAGKTIMYATLYNNATSQDFISKPPLTLAMEDLYAREMCYNFQENLDTDNVEYRGYEVGEIIYWPPANSFVIMYKQNGEKFSMQQVGKIDSGVEFFQNSGDIDVIFELEK